MAITVEHSAQCASSPERAHGRGRSRAARRTPATLDRMGARLELETRAAGLVARLSRAAGRGGGTTLPGKLVWKVDPGAVDALAARLAHGVVIVSATNGKTTTSAMAARVLQGSHRLAWNHSGANLASGVASTLLSSAGAELGLLEVDEFALPEVARRVRPRVVSLGNLFRDQLDRYGELEHIAERWRETVAALPQAATLVVNADDPLVGDARRGTRGSPPLRRGRRASRPSRPPARGRLEVLRPLRRPVRVRRRLRRPPRRLPVPSLWPCAAAARRRSAVDRAARARRLLVRSRTPRSAFGACACPSPVSTTSTTPSPRHRVSLALGHPARRRRRRPRGVLGRLRPLRAHRGRRPADPDAADQEPGRCERGGAHARGGRRSLRRSSSP